VIALSKLFVFSLFSFLLMALSQQASAGGSQDFNDCRTSSGDFCERAGSCSIQGSAWYQYVTIDKSGKFDSQGWPGLCDMVHVSLVQGTCEPIGSQENITAFLSSTSFAQVPSISGTLACGGDSDGGDSGSVEICNDGIDNDQDGKTDCADKRDCRRDSFCR
jgi:hypothetical protein